MTIPILSDIWNGITWTIDFFFSKTPRPLQILVFLLFLLFFGAMISTVLQITGFHCNNDKEMVKTDLFDVSTNFQMLRQSANDYFQEPTITIDEVHTWSSNTCFLLLDNSTGDYEPCVNESSATCLKYYESPQCFDCETVDVGWIKQEGEWVANNIGDVCIGSAYPIEWTFIQRWLTCGGECRIPNHYKFNATEGYYDCVDLEYCGVNATKVPNSKIDELLQNADGTLLYPTATTPRNYETLIFLKCNNNYNPRLTFFGIDLFDYKIWLLMIVIYVLVMVYFSLKK